MQSDCPNVAELESASSSAIRDHLMECASCRIVIELVAERKRNVEAGERRDECARFEMLLAARDEGTIGGTAGALLDDHLRSCASCQAVAATMPPPAERREHSSLPPVSTTAYALGREVARGGMGRILAAEDLRIGRPVAVKELLGKAPALAARFEREARVTARLQHPGIVPIYEIGKWPDGTPFYAMRMVKGRTLREALRVHKTLDERLALLPAVIAAAEAVGFAHGERIIHRDLTPMNILVGEYGDTVVIDWGLAKDLRETEPEGGESLAGPYRDGAMGDGNLTAIGAVIGTAAYMPPEQANGVAVDERADVYALGAILYHVLAGEAPYRSNSSAELVRQVQAGPPAAIASVAPGAPRDLVSIVDKAMARDGSARYASARELVDELRRFQTGRVVEAHSYSRRERTRRWIRHHRVGVVSSVAAAIAVATVGSFGLAGVIRERDRAEEQRDAAEVSRVMSDRERHRADELSSGLLEDRGRRELLDGNRERAAVYLSAAYSRGADSPALRFMLADAMTSVDVEISRLHYASADTVKFSHDGKSVIVGGAGHRSAIFDVASGTERVELEGAGAPNARFSADDTTVVGCTDRVLSRWQVTTGKLIASTDTQHDALQLSGEYDGGNLLAVASRKDGAVQIRDARTLALRAEDHDLHGVSDVRVSPDGRYLVSVDFDGTGAIRDARNGRVIHLLRGDKRLLMVGGSSFSPDSKRLVLGDVSGTTRVWDINTGNVLLNLVGDSAAAAQFDPTGRRILLADVKRNSYIVDATTGRIEQRFARSAAVTFVPRFAADGERLFVARILGPDSGSLDVIDIASGGVLQRVDGRQLVDEESSADLGAVITGDDVRLISLRSGRLRRRLAHDGLPLRGGFMNDGVHLITQQGETGWSWKPDSDDRVLLAPTSKLIDTSSDGSRQLVRTATGVELRDEHGLVLARLDHTDPGTAQFTLDDGHVVVHDLHGQLFALAASNGEVVATIHSEHGNFVMTSCSHTAGCASVDEGGAITNWSFNGHVVGTCRFATPAGSVHLSDDGSRMVATVATAKTESKPAWRVGLYSATDCSEIAKLGDGGPDRDVPAEFRGTRVLANHTVAEINDGRFVAKISPEPGEVKLLMSPDGRHVAVFSYGSSTKIWNLDGNTPIEAELEGYGFDGRFSLDGALFYLADQSDNVSVIDVASSRVVGHLPVPPPNLHIQEGTNGVNIENALVDASPRVEPIVTVGGDQYARVWNMARETRSPAAIARLVTALTAWKLDGAMLVRRAPPRTP